MTAEAYDLNLRISGSDISPKGRLQTIERSNLDQMKCVSLFPRQDNCSLVCLRSHRPFCATNDLKAVKDPS